MQKINLIVLVADEGKTIAHKKTGEIQGSIVNLGIEDNENNYIQVDALNSGEGEDN